MSNYSKAVSVAKSDINGTTGEAIVSGFANSDATIVLSIADPSVTVVMIDATIGKIRFTPKPAGFGSVQVTGIQDVNWPDNSGVFVATPHPITLGEVAQIGTNETDIGQLQDEVGDASQGLVKKVGDLESGKVDKVSGKGLSTNDYDDTAKAEVAKISNKVDQISGRELSEENFSVSLKSKLEGIPSDANKNIQIDWSETDTGHDAYIKNKPSLDFAPKAAGSNNAANGYVVVNNDGKIPSSLFDTGLDVANYVTRGEFDALGTKVAANSSRYTNAQIDTFLAGKSDDHDTTQFVTRDEILSVQTDPSKTIPQANITGLEDRLIAIETGHTSDSLKDLIEDAVEEINPRSIDRSLNARTVTVYVKETDDWTKIDDNLDIRVTEDQEDIGVRYNNNLDYPDKVNGKWSYKVRHDGKDYRGKDNKSSLRSGSAMQDWWGGWFLNHHEFNGNERVEGTAKLILKDFDPDPEGSGFKRDTPCKVYTITGRRWKKKSERPQKSFPWRFEITITGSSLTENTDFDENKHYGA